jgi:hypothetical protein
MATDIADIFRRHGSDYARRYGSRMLASHRKALWDLSACRTGALGGHLCGCDQCDAHHYRYHSCRSRFCPKCQWQNTDRWIDAKRRQLLPVTYFHLVFTVPQELRTVIRSHQKALLAVLFRSAVSALTDLAGDPHYVGGRIGVLAVLHTWTRAMIYHPHLHCIVPAGAIDPKDGSWRPARHNYLVPIHALSSIFRARFMALARKALPLVDFPGSVWDKAWVVYSKRAVQGSAKVLDYLGRYVHRVAITNRRIVACDARAVTFRYLDRCRHAWKTASLAPDEFIRRFLQHVLPRGFHKVRSYGLLSQAYQPKLQHLQEQLSPERRRPHPDRQPNRPAHKRPSYGICPNCQKGLLVPILWLPRWPRAPPPVCPVRHQQCDTRSQPQRRSPG